MRDQENSPGSSRDPRYLVKGLRGIFAETTTEAENHFEQLYIESEANKIPVIERWERKHPGSRLPRGPNNRRWKWPEALITELAELDREAIREGWNKQFTLFTEANAKMQELVSF